MKYITTIGEREYTIEIVSEKLVIVDGIPYEVDFASVSGQPVYSLLIDGKSYEGYMYPDDDDWEVLLQGAMYAVNVEDERERRLRQALGEGPSQSGEFHLKAPMPGLVITIPVSDGQEITKGDEGCCVKVASNRELDLDQFMEKYGFMGERSGFKFLRWHSPTSFEFQFHDRKFRATNIESVQVKIIEAK